MRKPANTRLINGVTAVSLDRQPSASHYSCGCAPTINFRLSGNAVGAGPAPDTLLPPHYFTQTHDDNEDR